jgi:hypothetical protein
VRGPRWGQASESWERFRVSFGAMLSFTSGVAAQNYGNLSGKMGVSAVQIQAPLPSPPGPGPYRGNR